MDKKKEDVIEEFDQLLLEHNWTDMKSSDPVRYKRGRLSLEKINNFIKENSEFSVLLREMYENADPFNNNTTII
jgi:hypothetical protein